MTQSFTTMGNPTSWRRHWTTLLLSIATLVGATRHASAQHFDVLVQVVDGRLATGSADVFSDEWSLGRQVYSYEFDSDYAVTDPGFNTLTATSPSMPAGASALPGNSPLGWDFLPMKIDGSLANLFYWNGAGSSEEEVDFGALPGPDYKFELYGRTAAAGVDGSPLVVPGNVINNTGSNGSLHTHRSFYLDSGNLNAVTTPDDGIYLASMRLKMPGLDSSQPIYFVFGTPGSTLAALQAAETWVTDRVTELAPDFNADFNDDFVVDGADFLIWQRNLGAQNALLSSGDADRDGIVGPGDLDVWRDEFGLSLESYPGVASPPLTLASHAVPEPSAMLLSLIALGLSSSAFRSTPLRLGGGHKAGNALDVFSAPYTPRRNREVRHLVG